MDETPSESASKRGVSRILPELHIPERHATQRGSFDTRPGHVEAWIAGLPTAHVGQTTRELYSALLEVNHLDVNRHHRFRMLEMCRAPVHYVTQALDRHFVGQAFPLPPRNRKVSQLTRELLAETATGYKIVIHDELGKSLFLKDAKLLTTSIYRALEYLGLLLLKSYQVYAPVPTGIWGEIYQLYHYAEVHDLERIPVRGGTGNGRFGCIADVFKQILLLSLAGPYRLRQEEVPLVQERLQQWAPHCVLERFDAHPVGGIVVDLGADAPPSYLTEEMSTGSTNLLRVLDTARLEDDVRTALLNNHLQQRPALQPQPMLSDDTLQRLQQSWRVAIKRQASRSRQYSTVLVAMGLHAAHYFISGEAVFRNLFPEGDGADTEPESGNAPALDVYAHLGPDVDQRSDFSELWDMDSTLAGRPWLREIPSPEQMAALTSHRHYQAQSWELVNISAGGYCLLRNSFETSHAQVGELVALRETDEPDAFHWMLGVVRWIKHVEEPGLALGIELLAPGAIGVGTRMWSPEGSTNAWLRSLLVPAMPSRGRPATLLTPNIPYKVGSRVSVNVHGKESRVQLTRVAHNTGGFAQYHFTALPDEPQRNAPEPVAPVRPRADYSALWGKI